MRAPVADEVSRERSELTASWRAELDPRRARGIDHEEGAIEALDACLTVVEGLDHREARRVRRTPIPIDVGPAARIAGTRQPLVKNVEVLKPLAVQDRPVVAQVRRASVFGLRDRDPVSKVARVAPRTVAAGRAVRGDMAVATVEVAHRAAPLLVVAAPRIALCVRVAPIGRDVMPAVARLYRRRPS